VIGILSIKKTRYISNTKKNLGEILMKAVGLIVEYNPFHNGHKYHLEKAMEIAKGDVSIAVMSGNFLQRGEPALLNKWLRTEMAIENGVDVVVELPSFYSNQTAEIFGEGAIKIIDRLKCSSIVFGAEEGDVSKLTNLAEIQLGDDFHRIIKEKLATGFSYPNCVAMTYEEICGEKNILNPNNILGIEYIKALKKFESKTEALCIKREKVGYHDTEITDKIASASGIRKMLFEERYMEIKEVLPKASYDIIMNNLDKCAKFENFYPLIRFSLIKDKESISSIQDMEEGLWNRLYKGALKNRDFEGFMKDISSSRYTQSRINRVLSHVLLKMEKDEIEDARKGLPYIRVLGYSSKGAEYMKMLKKEYGIEFIISLKNAEKIVENKVFLDREIDRDTIYKMLYPYEDRPFAIYKK
jgi:predicted nucleotidyltransferase